MRLTVKVDQIREAGQDLYTQLRLRKKRRKRYGSQNRRGMIPNLVSIEKRLAVVDQR